MTAAAGDSALVSLVDHGDDEIMTSLTQAFDQNEDAYINMENDTDQLLGDSEAKKSGVFSMAYYAQLFDVDTDDIISRLAWSSFPRPTYTQSFAKNKIKSKPDLYGPFWICVTLVFSVAIAGNVASYFQHQLLNTGSNSQAKHWHYDFHKVTWSATIVFLYATLMPSGLFTVLWSSSPKDAPNKPSFIELACVFGYSMAPFVPASLFWLIQVSAVQWVFVFVSFALSGGVLALSLWPTITEHTHEKTKGYALIAAVLALHLLLASGFMLCFFHVPSQGSAAVVPNGGSNVIQNATQAVQAIDVKAAAQEQSAEKSHEGKREVTKKINVVKESVVKEDETMPEMKTEVAEEDLTTKTSVKKALDENAKFH